MQGEVQARQRCQQRLQPPFLPLTSLPASRLCTYTSVPHPRSALSLLESLSPAIRGLVELGVGRRQQDLWATLCPELCPALSLIGDCAHAGPSTLECSFLSVDLCLHPSQPARAKKMSQPQQSLPWFHPQPRAIVPLLNYLLTCALQALF